MREDERRTIGLRDDLGHREGFAGTGDAEKDLVLVAGFDAGEKLIDGSRLIAARLVVAVQLEFHREGLLPVRRAWQKRSLYPRKQAARFWKEASKAQSSARERLALE